RCRQIPASTRIGTLVVPLLERGLGLDEAVAVRVAGDALDGLDADEAGGLGALARLVGAGHGRVVAAQRDRDARFQERQERRRRAALDRAPVLVARHAGTDQAPG